jgi:alpha-N-arabinofuranosidase
MKYRSRLGAPDIVKSVILWLGSVCFLSLLLTQCRGQSLPSQATYDVAKVEIDASKQAAYKIPRTIFGTFLEPIGNSTYGGLWADVLENPSLEEGLWSAAELKKVLDREPQLVRASELGLPIPWEPLFYEQQNRYAPQWTDTFNSFRSLQIMGLPETEVGIRQKVYLPVHRIPGYSGSLYAKLLSGSRALHVSIRQRNHPEVTLAKSSITLNSTDWTRYEFHLGLPPVGLKKLEPSDFVISVEGDTTILVDQISLLPDDNVDGMDLDMISMSRAMKSPIVRFGGNFTSAYHWRDGIGPREKRVSMTNVAWGIPEYNTFGTDEFLHFCELIGARPQVALNLGTGTPEEAAGWVRYIDDRWGTKSGGLTWELGNELWGKFQVGYPGLQRVAERTRTFSDAVRRVDPTAVLIATGGDADSYRDWNSEQLQNASAFNYLSTHFVVTTTAVQKAAPSPDFIALANFALPVGLQAKLREMYGQIQSHPQSRDKVKIAFTEWLFWAQGDTVVRYDTMGGAVAAAGFLNMLMRNADIVPISDMTGIIFFGGIQKERSKVFGTPAYWAFRMFANAPATTVVETHVASAEYSVEEGSTRLPRIERVPYLDVVAALDDSKETLTLFCVNRHLTRDVSAEFSISGFHPLSESSAQTLFAPSISMKNDETDPEGIRPVDVSVTLNKDTVRALLRPASVTVVTLRRAR